MALFSEDSSWIWLKGRRGGNTYGAFRQTFRCGAEGGGHARLRISAEGRYAAFLNGTWVPSSQYGDFPCYKSVQTTQVDALLAPGENTLEIQVWYQGEDTSVSRREPPGLRFELERRGEILCASGAGTQARLLDDYDTADVESLTPQLGAGFRYRRRSEGPWERAETVDKAARCVPRPIRELDVGAPRPAAIVSQGVFEAGPERGMGERMQSAGLFFRTWAQLTGGQVPPVLPSERGVCLRSGERDGIYLVLDLGEIQLGYLELDLTCPAETRVEVGFGEHLEDLRVRTAVGGRCFAVGYTAPPARRPFCHYFRPLGLRYLELFLYAHEATIYYAGVRPVTYPVDHTPEFQCEDLLHRRIWQVSRATLLNCMHEHYADCPWREQALYGFDARSQMLAGYYAWGEFDYARENLRLLALSQREDGLLELCAPARVPVTIPGFSLAFPVAVEEYCRYSGDLAFALEMLPVIERILACVGRRTQGGLAMAFPEPGYWNFYEWRPLLDGAPIHRREHAPPSADAALQLLFLLALERTSALMGYLGLGRAGYADAIARLKGGLEAFWNEERGAYAAFLRGGAQLEYAQLVQALALYTDACPEARREGLRRKLCSGDLTPVTLGMSLFKYEALLREPERYGGTVFGEVAQRWGSMLFQGATAFWETDEGAAAFDRAGSLCHGWSAVPVYLYGAYAMGVRPASPGVWRRERPAGGLHGVRGTLKTPSGYLRICGTADA